MQGHKSRSSVLKIKKKCSIREIKYSYGILFQIFFHKFGKEKKVITVSLIIHLFSVINHENWSKSQLRNCDRYEYREIYLDSIFTALTSSSLMKTKTLEPFPRMVQALVRYRRGRRTNKRGSRRKIVTTFAKLSSKASCELELSSNILAWARAGKNGFGKR